jgi:hypothetical protein
VSTAAARSALGAGLGRLGLGRLGLARAGLLVVAAFQAEIGVWGSIAPHSLYASYPGGGHHWISAMGPYDEHLVRDFAAMELGMAVLLVCAAIWFERRLVLVSGAAFLAATIPHFAYHLTTTGMLPSSDDVLSLGGFVVEMAIIAGAMAAVAAVAGVTGVPGPSQPKGASDGTNLARSAPGS